MMLVYDMPKTKLLKVVSLVSTRQKNGVCLSIVVEDADEILDLDKGRGIVR